MNDFLRDGGEPYDAADRAASTENTTVTSIDVRSAAVAREWLAKGNFMTSRFVSSCLVVGLLATATGATATTIVSHGADFHAYNASEVAQIDYFGNGVRTIAAARRTIIAAFKRNPVSSGSQTFTVRGFHQNGVQETVCSIFSYDAAGNLLTGNTVTTGLVAGAWSKSVSIPFAQLANNAHVSATCTIPASGAGIITGLLATP